MVLSRELVRQLVVHCKKDEYDVYIGRTARGIGRWGNKYTHKRTLVHGCELVESRREAVRCYGLDLVEGIETGSVHPGELAGLAGLRLGCWCAPSLCHGHVLAVGADVCRELLGMEKGELSRAVCTFLQRMDLL